MLSNNDLYDLSAVFKEIRSDISYEHNVIIIEKLLELLSKSSYVENQIRIGLSSIGKLDAEKWKFIYHNNLYTHLRLLKNLQIYEILTAICRELKNTLDQQKYDQADRLVDAVHCLPEMIAENQFGIPNSYWKTCILPYRKEWNKYFLREEEKKYRKL